MKLKSLSLLNTVAGSILLATAAYAQPGIPPIPGMPLPQPFPEETTLPGESMPDGTVLPAHVQRILDWCNSVPQTLTHAQYEAMALNAEGNTAQAILVIQNAWARALQGVQRSGRIYSLSATALRRGQGLLATLPVQAPNNPMASQDKYRFASEWTNLVVRVAQSFDASYIAYRYQVHNRCDFGNCAGYQQFDPNEFANQYLSFISDQFRILPDLFDIMGVPYGNPRTVFQLANQLLGQVVQQDLTWHPSAFSFACQTRHTVQLWRRIQVALRTGTNNVIQREWSSVMDQLRYLSGAFDTSMQCHGGGY